MSNCKCKHPCNPCNDNCPDDEITEIRDTIKTSAPLEVELLDADECSGPCGGCCSSWCKDNCGINIQSTNECLTVDTSECWVVKLTAECPKPTYVKAWDNITVEEETPPSDCYSNWWDCWIKWWWKISSTDENVKACDWDTTPWTLIDKLEEGEWINIDPIWCAWSNSKLRISFDDSILPKCPEPPELKIINRSKLINVTQDGEYEHRVTITDAASPYYYAKVILAEWHDWIRDNIANQSTPTFLLWWTSENWRTVYNQNMIVQGWRIKITKKWLYQVGFSGSAECWSWVHAFRVQLYASTEDASNNNTLIESRYSAPIWDQLFEINAIWIKRYVVDVDEDWWTTYSQIKIDNPLWWPATDIEWTQREAQGKSASLWSYMSRFPVGNSTIVEMDVWDYIWIWVKISTEVRYDWDLLWKVDDLTWHFALLCENSHRSWWKNTGWECWLCFYANLIHPLN